VPTRGCGLALVAWSALEMTGATALKVFALLCLIVAVGGFGGKRLPHTAHGSHDSSNNLRRGEACQGATFCDDGGAHFGDYGII